MRAKFLLKMTDDIKDRAKNAIKNQDNINKTEMLELARVLEKSPETKMTYSYLGYPMLV